MKLYFISTALPPFRSTPHLSRCSHCDCRVVSRKYLHVMAFEGIYVSPQSCRMATPCSLATGDFTRWKMRQTRESENHINQSVGELLCSLAKKRRHCLTRECSIRSHRQIDYQYSNVYTNHCRNHIQPTPHSAYRVYSWENIKNELSRCHLFGLATSKIQIDETKTFSVYPWPI